METLQRNFILENLDELVYYTTCHSLLIAFLESRNFLEASDIEQLNSLENRHEKARKLYEIIITRENSFNNLCDALLETKQTGAYDILKSHQDATNPIRFEVRNPVHLFTGREEELDKLHKNMTTTDLTTTLITQRTSITGLGGIGKTELCRRYIQKYSDYYDENVICIGAEKVADMQNSFKTLAKDHLSISLKDVDGGDKDIKTVVDEVYTYFQDKKSLFVFDNALSSNGKYMETFMPVRIAKKPFLIVTSRDKDWEQPFNILELDEFKPQEAIEFVKKGLLISDSNQDDLVIQLVDILQRFPLALQQAISFINQQRKFGNIDIGEYLKTFDTNSKQLLNYETSAFLTNKYAKTTFTTWKITTDVIATDDSCGGFAINLMDLMSYFESERIPVGLLEKFQNAPEDLVHSALQLLVKYSMINYQVSEGTFNIHRLVQEVTRLELKTNGKEEAVTRAGFELMQPNIDRKSVSHAVQLYEYGNCYDSNVKEFTGIPRKIITHLQLNYSYHEAYSFGDKSLAALTKHFKQDDIEVLRTMMVLGEIAYEHGKYDECLSSFGKIQEMLVLKDNCQELESEILTVQYYIAKSLTHKGESIQSIMKLCDVFDRQKQIYGITHPHIILTVNGILAGLSKLRKFKEALGFCKHILYLYQEQNVKFSNTFLLIHSMALIYRELNDLNMAVTALKPVYSEIVGLFEISAEPTEIGHTLAQLLLEQNKIGEAYQVASKVYESRKSHLGSENVDTLRSLQLIADLKRKEEKWEEALPILHDIYSKFSKQLGEFQLHTLNAKSSLAMCLARMECFDEALKALCEILDVQLELCGPFGERTLETVSKIAYVLGIMKAYQDAVALYKEIEKIIESKFGQEDARLVDIRERIIMLLVLAKEIKVKGIINADGNLVLEVIDQ